jgi:folate-binding protein YgfZ
MRTTASELMAWRSGRIALRLPLTFVEVRGRDSRKVLNNLCTAPIAQLVAYEGHEAFITDVRGKTLGHGFVFALDDRLLVCGAAGQGDAITAHIDRYTIREDAQATDRSPELQGWLISGADPVAPWRAALGWSTDRTPLANAGLRAVRIDGLPEFHALEVSITSPSDLLLVADDATLAALRDWCAASAIECIGADHPLLSGLAAAMEATRIAGGFPWFGRDFDQTALPQELARDQRAISFTKGCYLGQETVARLDALGQVQKRLTGLTLSPEIAVLESGAELATSDGRPAGRITSLVSVPQYAVALGFVRRGAWDSGNQLSCPSGLATVAAWPIALPRSP